MNICHAYGPPVTEAQAERVLLAALDAGITHFDTAALYGFGMSETLVGRFLSAHRSRFLLASKCGMTGVDVDGSGRKVRVIDGRPQTIRATCDEALQRLRTEVIDLYYLHRWDRAIPIEDSVGALADVVRAGKIREGAFDARRELLGVRAGVEQHVAPRDAHIESALAHVDGDVLGAQEEELHVVVRILNDEITGRGRRQISRLAQHLAGGIGELPLIGQCDAQHVRAARRRQRGSRRTRS
jgi:hypothetical protein